ncbi:Rhodanese-like domain-containing protein [Limtongia smithiae]|uniref:Rhodanese-like domain-containing protein n=1 Tax=Limtongia smithiae TaxID=1125753 RepID=UPI0034CDFA7B
MVVKTISKNALRSWILSEQGLAVPKFAVIDVRDDDYVGGHIKESLHHPSTSFARNLPLIHEELRDHAVVVFHCALSQQRGPSAANMYMRYIEGLEDDATASKQQIYVLRGGFTEWQRDFGTDERLTEDYASDIWKYY